MLDLKNLFGKKKSDQSGGAPQPLPTPEAKSGVAGFAAKLFDRNEKEVAKLRPTVERIAGFADELKQLSDDELKARSHALRQRFRDDVTVRLSKLKDDE